MVGKTIGEQVIDDFIKSLEGNKFINQPLLDKLKLALASEDKVSKDMLLSLLSTEAKDESN